MFLLMIVHLVMEGLSVAFRSNKMGLNIENYANRRYNTDHSCIVKSQEVLLVGG